MKNNSVGFLSCLPQAFRVKWRPALQRLVADNSYLSVTDPPPQPPSPDPHPLPYPWTRPPASRPPRRDAGGTAPDVIETSPNQQRRLGKFKLKGGAAGGLRPAGAEGSGAPPGLTRQDGGGRSRGRVRAGPAAQQQVGVPARDPLPCGPRPR